MNLPLRCLVWAACLPLLWPPGVCPHHGPVALLTGQPLPPDDPAEPCCLECHGADQSRLVEPVVTVALDLPAIPQPAFAAPPCPIVHLPAPPPDPSPPLYRTLCRLAC